MTSELAHSVPHRRAGSLLGIYVVLTLVSAVGGASFVAAKVAVTHMAPMALAGARFTPAAACLLFLLLLSRKPRPPIRRSDLPLIVALGATGVTIQIALQYSALRIATASETAIIGNTIPALTTLLAVLILGERWTRGLASGIVLAFAGVVAISVAKDGLAVSPDHLLADLGIFGMALSMAAYSVFGKLVLGRFSPLAVSTYACIAGSTMLLPLVLIENRWQELPAAPPEAWLALAYLILPATVFLHIGYFYGVARIGASRAVMFGNLAPIVAMALAAVILKEAITFWSVLGATLVIGGIYLTSSKR